MNVRQGLQLIEDMKSEATEFGKWLDRCGECPGQHEYPQYNEMMADDVDDLQARFGLHV